MADNVHVNGKLAVVFFTLDHIGGFHWSSRFFLFLLRLATQFGVCLWNEKLKREGWQSALYCVREYYVKYENFFFRHQKWQNLATVSLDL